MAFTLYERLNMYGLGTRHVYAALTPLSNFKIDVLKIILGVLYTCGVVHVPLSYLCGGVLGRHGGFIKPLLLSTNKNGHMPHQIGFHPNAISKCSRASCSVILLVCNKHENLSVAEKTRCDTIPRYMKLFLLP